MQREGRLAAAKGRAQARMSLKARLSGKMIRLGAADGIGPQETKKELPRKYFQTMRGKP